LHYLSGYPGWELPTTLLCGARTFLDNVATAWPTHQLQAYFSSR
jgi:hypothetical protein